MPKTILYYVSPHGFGHARRAAEVIRAINALDPAARIIVRAAVPPRIYATLSNTTVAPPKLAVDPGLAEHHALRIDVDGSLQRLRDVLASFDRLVQAETAFARESRADMVVSDISFMAGHIAAAAGLPCVAISNFTWDWIYCGLFGDDPRYAAVAPVVAEGYAKMTRLLRLPFGGVSDRFARIDDIPLLASHPRFAAEAVLKQLPPAARLPRPRILIAQRGGLDPSTLCAVAAGTPDLTFLTVQPVPPAAPPNLHAVELTPECDFTDVLNVCDIAISKLGYGTISECIATGKALLWPRREGFVEDAASEREIPAYVRTRELPLDDFGAGRWAPHIRALLGAPPPPRTMPTNGAEVAAKVLLEQ